MGTLRQVGDIENVEMPAGDYLLATWDVTEDHGDGPQPIEWQVGDSFDGAVFRKRSDTDALASLTVAAPDDGVLTVEFPVVLTGTTLGPGAYAWRARLIRDDKPRTLLSGRLTLTVTTAA